MNRGAEFYAQKQVLKKRTNALEVELEKEIMTSESQFIVKLHGMISDFEYHYFLMGEVFCIEYSIKDPRSTTVFSEACLGGDLMSLLQSKKFLPESSTRFYAASVIEAIRFLHKNNVIYRDIKPENLLLGKFKIRSNIQKLLNFRFFWVCKALRFWTGQENSSK